MASQPKSFALSPELHEYLVRHGTPPDEIQRELIEETTSLGPISVMQIAPEQGAFLTLLTRAIGARRAVEVGTFTGYSALSIARGLPNDGYLLCCDVNAEWTAIARRFWEKAGVAYKIELKLAPALDTLEALSESSAFDLAFIDADKASYLSYFEALLPRMRGGGLILVDNVLWGGRVCDLETDDEKTRAIRHFNDRVAKDPRVDRVMLPIADGLSLLRKR